ncbi:MAG: mechanosensitive ion channel [Ignavibacteria bacterium]|nr:mechanosensitive ion channel [Ignavibacteria bacterium]
MDAFLQFLRSVKHAAQSLTFTLGNSSITAWSILYLLALLFVLIYVSGKLKDWAVNRLFARSGTDIGVRQAIGTIARYVILSIGFIVVFQTAGVDLSAVTILAGALGVGVGFGLQNITDNFVSGLIILFERPVKVGDRIQVADITGDVIRISPRATTIVTNDNISIIVPNSEFISSRVINWSHSDRMVRLHVPVGVAYKSDAEFVKELLFTVASEHPGVLKDPQPDVIFEEFGNSSLNFVLRVWTTKYITTPPTLRSDLNFRIKKIFNENGVEIPFPQRDLHVKSGVLDVKSVGSDHQM